LENRHIYSKLIKPFYVSPLASVIIETIEFGVSRSVSLLFVCRRGGIDGRRVVRIRRREILSKGGRGCVFFVDDRGQHLVCFDISDLVAL
jgi:hypothetical protein